MNVYRKYAGSEAAIAKDGGHICIKDLREENERLRKGQDKGLANTNMNLHQRVKNYEKFTFPVYLKESDFTVETNEGPMSAQDLNLVKATCIELMAKKQQKLYDVSSGLISALSEIHGGKWYSNIRPLLVEHGICLHC